MKARSSAQLSAMPSYEERIRIITVRPLTWGLEGAWNCRVCLSTGSVSIYWRWEPAEWNSKIWYLIKKDIWPSYHPTVLIHRSLLCRYNFSVYAFNTNILDRKHFWQNLPNIASVRVIFWVIFCDSSFIIKQIYSMHYFQLESWWGNLYVLLFLGSRICTLKPSQSTMDWHKA